MQLARELLLLWEPVGGGARRGQRFGEAVAVGALDQTVRISAGAVTERSVPPAPRPMVIADLCRHIGREARPRGARIAVGGQETGRVRQHGAHLVEHLLEREPKLFVDLDRAVGPRERFHQLLWRRIDPTAVVCRRRWKV